MNNFRSRLLAFLVCFAAAMAARPSYAQLRIVTYNAATDTNPSGDTARAGMATVLQAIGIESKNGIQRPIDILSLQETTSSLGGAQSIVNVLNSIYGAGTYARSTLVGSSTDSTTLAVIYNTQTVQLTGQVQVGTASTSGAARAPLRFQFQPVGYDPSADFYVYSEHYKAGSESSDQSRRQVEAAAVRADANALGAGARIIFTGDYNIQSSSETMYQTLTAAGGPGQAIDPLNSPGNWNNNASFAGIHTQAPLITGVNGLTGGGMDDRFDFQLLSSPMLSGQGVSYIGPSVPNLSGSPSQNSYHASGNNGTTFNNNINSPSNTALPAAEYGPTATQPSRTDVLNALTTASDHLPLVADYQLPAKMGVGLSSVPAQVIVNTPLSVNVSVSNVAPVGVALGADQLDYSVAGSGAASGAGSGSLLALAAANVHPLSLATNALGPQTGTVNASSTSVSVANGTFNQNVNYTVLDHSSAEFVSPSSTHTLNINFGTLALNSGLADRDFQISNLPALYRAGLDLDSFLETGDLFNRFSTNLMAFTDLASGDSTGLYHLLFDTSQAGSFSASYVLSLGDDAGILGATGGQSLTLNVSASVVATPEPASIVLMSIALLGLLGFRSRRYVRS